MADMIIISIIIICVILILRYQRKRKKSGMHSCCGDCNRCAPSDCVGNVTKKEDEN